MTLISTENNNIKKGLCIQIKSYKQFLFYYNFQDHQKNSGLFF